ncbi:MAG: AraC family transcriptional regulator, partial [Spirochaetaceae bacterium]|nr:AraC family transcriptional regulator [Spirochaetaceae bacterium]
MKSNLHCIARIVDYIETHLDEKLDLEGLAREAQYSKHHLHKMFTGIVGFTVHSYVQRRRLTEAARLLVFSDKPIMEIALGAGYETQQSFTVAFKALY